MTTNGAAATTQLTPGQIKQLQNMIGPYLVQLEAQEQKANSIRTTINAIAGAYLVGLGLPAELNVDLQTGMLTAVTAPENASG